MEQKSFHQDANFNQKLIFGFFTLLMIGFSVYLTSHYFSVKFPTGLGEGSLCNFNSFFNCDTATHSNASNLFGVPISLFGIITGLFALTTFFFTSKAYEGTVHTLLRINFLGCIILFIYSLAALESLCPFCSLYYLASGLALFIFHRTSKVTRIDLKQALIFIIIFSIFGVGVKYHVSEKEAGVNKLADSLLSQYNALPNLGAPKKDSPFFLAKATEKFTDAPIQLTFFSDFQCPACKRLYESSVAIEKKYKGKVNIQYIFYPLDQACNPAITRPFHQYACMAARLAICLPSKFHKVHADIFIAQDSLDYDWIKAYAKKEKVKECLEKEQTKKTLSEVIALSGPFNIKSTPSMLVNGVKIEGVLPLNQLYIILDHLLEKNKN